MPLPEQVLPPAVEGQPENALFPGAGPLDGLEGILPLEDILLTVPDTTFLSGNLQLTEPQSVHSEILANMFEENAKPAASEAETHPGGSGLLRILFGLILGTVVLIPLLIPALKITDSGALVNPTVQQFFNELYILPKEAPILVAVDFDPGFYGEMKLVSSPVFRHLVLRSSHLVFVSTNPAGSAMGENLLRDALSEMQGSQFNPASYNLQLQSENLGFLPGGLASLREITSDIRRVTRFGVLTLRDKRSPWNGPSLTDINSINDFGAVILLADNLDTGRAWIEQVQPSVGQTPILVISSAGAWPVMEPYFQSGQIRGLIAGFKDAQAYEKASGLPPANTNALVSYQLGSLLAVGFILAGCVIVFISKIPGWFKAAKGGRK
jgi:hypothetical protein